MASPPHDGCPEVGSVGRDILDESCLADSGFTDDECQSATAVDGPANAGAKYGQLRVPADGPAHAGVHGDPALAGLHRAGRGACGRHGGEHRVLVEDCALESAELGTRIDSQLFGQGVASVPERTESLGLSAGPVQRNHQLTAQTLAKRVDENRPLELGDDLRVMTNGEERLEPVLRGRRSQLVPVARRRSNSGAIGELEQGIIAPQRQCLIEGADGNVVPAGQERCSSGVQQCLEPVSVHVVAIDCQLVSSRRGHDQVCAQSATKLEHDDLQSVRRPDRALCCPQVLDQPVGAHRDPGPEGQERQQGALPPPTDGNRFTRRSLDSQRPEQADAHAATLASVLDGAGGQPATRWSGRRVVVARYRGHAASGGVTLPELSPARPSDGSCTRLRRRRAVWRPEMCCSIRR